MLFSIIFGPLTGVSANEPAMEEIGISVQRKTGTRV